MMTKYNSGEMVHFYFQHMTKLLDGFILILEEVSQIEKNNIYVERVQKVSEFD